MKNMNEEQLRLFDFWKEMDDIAFSTYYYSKEKYKDIRKDYLKSELKWYQKILIKIINIKSKFKRRGDLNGIRKEN